MTFSSAHTPDYETNPDGFSFTVVATSRKDAADEKVARQDVTIAITDLDEVPSGLALSRSALTLAENTDTTGRLLMADILVTDADGGTNQLSLSGADSDHFVIDGNRLYLQAGTVLDYDAGQRSYTVSVSVTGSGTGTNPAAVSFVLTLSNADEDGSIAGLAAPVQGTELVVPVITDPNGVDEVVSWRWQKSHDGGTLWTDAAVTQTFTPGEADVGALLRLIVSYTNTLGITKSVTAAASAAVADINDKAPVFTHTAPDALPEGTEVSATTPVYQAVVSPDVAGDTLTFTLEGADRGLFTISNDGAVTFSSAHTPDYETNPDGFSFTVVATSRKDAADELVARQDVTIAITDLDETPTALALSARTLTLAENTVISSDRKLADITLEDDALGTNLVSLSDTRYFRLIGDALYLKAGTELDFETMGERLDVSVSVTASGQGDAPAAQTFSLIIEDVDEPPSGLTLVPVRVNQPRDEDWNRAVKLADIVLDDDALGDQGFRLDGDKGPFKIKNGNQLWVKAGAHFDYETQARYEVIVIAKQDASVRASYVWQVRNLDEEGRFADWPSGPPVEDRVLSAPLIHDPDNEFLAPRPVRKLTKAKQHEPVEVTGYLWQRSADGLTGWFTIDGATQADYTPGDSDVGQFLRVIVTYTDRHGPGKTLTTAPTAAVDGVDDAPTGLSLTPVITVLTEDTDTATAIKLADITIADVDGGYNRLALSGADAARFQIINDGLYLRAGTALDYEDKDSLSVMVSLADTSLPAQSYSLALTNVDEGPGQLAITGSVAVGQTLTGALSADPDDGPAHVSWQWQQRQDGTWTDITDAEDAAYLLSIADVGRTMRLLASYTDGGGFDQQVVSAPVTLADILPTGFSVQAIAAQIEENTAHRTELARLIFTDTDGTGSPVLLSGAGAGLFAVEATDDAHIRLLVLKAGQSLDYETGPKSYTLTLTPSLVPALEQTFTVTVGDVDEAERFAPFAVVPVEGVALAPPSLSDPDGDVRLFRVLWQRSTDPDADTPVWTNVTGWQAELAYTPSADDVGAYLRVMVRYDTAFGVKLGTSGPSAPVTDSHDADPVFTSAGTVVLTDGQSYAATDTLLTVVAVPDIAGSPVTYSLSGPDAYTSGDGTGTFIITADGAVRFHTDTRVDADAAKTSYSLVVSASVTAGGTTREARQTLTLTIADVNDEPPVITSAGAGPAVAELTRYDTDYIVYTARAVPDVAGQVISWTLAGPDAGLFAIDAEGQVTFAADTVPDYETRREGYSLTVVATVAGQSARRDVHIAITDKDDPATGLTVTRHVTSLSEATDTTQRLVLATLSYTDDALGINRLTLVGADADKFEIDGGALYLKAGTTLDYEGQGGRLYIVNINLSTSREGGGPVTLSEAFRLNILNEDEAGHIGQFARRRYKDSLCRYLALVTKTD